MDFEGVKIFIINKLKAELNPALYYHDIHHTLDVYESAERIAKLENVSDEELILIKTASLFHDSGMLKTYTGHEEASCEISGQYLPEFGYDQQQIDIINRMIMTTKLPQSASERLEQILCDADLDYLGRDDFYMISHRLKLEWILQNFMATTLKEWYYLQINFLNGHKYFTKSAFSTREKGKQKNLREIIQIMDGLHK
nr:HD domain-containing protein [Bacteroidota bacterium]